MPTQKQITSKNLDIFLLKKELLEKKIISKKTSETIESIHKLQHEPIHEILKYKLYPEIKYNNTYVLEIDKIGTKNPELNYNILINILDSLGLKRSSDPKSNHLFGIISKKFYSTQFFLLNNFQFIRDFNNKYSLYKYLNLCFPLHYTKNYPNSFLLHSNLDYKDISTKIYIARPISGFSGKDIIIIHNQETLERAKANLYKLEYKTGVSLTEYITNPMLIKGRKFHFRAYIMFTLINNIFKAYLLDIGGIYTAKLPYRNEDWDNKDIHDTHLGSSYRKDLLFPDDLYGNTTPNIYNRKDFDIIYNNARETCSHVAAIAVSNIHNYNNTRNTWEIYGIDLLVREDLSVFVMEVNSAYTGYEGTPDKLLEKYFQWVKNTVIIPALFPHLKTEDKICNNPILEAKIENY
jgi:hypothetical protein